MKVLFVCTGNLCRSPMAEALFALIVKSRKYADVEVASAGTWAAKASPATPDAIDVLASVGVDIEGHRSKPLRRRDVEAADLIVAMTSVHSLEIQDKVPESVRKVVLLKEIGEIEMPDLPPAAPPEERLKHFLNSRRPKWRRQLDLDDPMGLPRVAYIRCLKEVWDGVEVLANALCPRAEMPPQAREEISGEAEASA